MRLCSIAVYMFIHIIQSRNRQPLNDLSIRSLLLCLIFYHSQSSPSLLPLSVGVLFLLQCKDVPVVPPLPGNSDWGKQRHFPFQLFNHAHPLWWDLSFIFAGKMEPGDRLKGKVIVRFVGNQWATRVIFPQPLQSTQEHIKVALTLLLILLYVYFWQPGIFTLQYNYYYLSKKI